MEIHPNLFIQDLKWSESPVWECVTGDLLSHNLNVIQEKLVPRRRLKGLKKRRTKYQDMRKNREKPCVGKF